MTRVQKMGRILACADGWFWPFSRTARKNEPAGHRDRDPAGDRQEAWLGSRRLLGQHGHALWAGRAGRRLRPLDRQRHLRHRLRPHHHGRRSSHAGAPACIHAPVHEHRLRAGDARRGQRPRRRWTTSRHMHIKIGVPAYSPMSEYAQSHGFEYDDLLPELPGDRCADPGRSRRGDDLVGRDLAGAGSSIPKPSFEMAKGYVPSPRCAGTAPGW